MNLDLATTVVGVLVLLSISVLIGTAFEAAPRRGGGTLREQQLLAGERQELVRAQRRLKIARAMLMAAAQRSGEQSRHGCPQCGYPIPPPSGPRRS